VIRPRGASGFGIQGRNLLERPFRASPRFLSPRGRGFVRGRMKAAKIATTIATGMA